MNKNRQELFHKITKGYQVVLHNNNNNSFFQIVNVAGLLILIIVKNTIKCDIYLFKLSTFGANVNLLEFFFGKIQIIIIN